MVALNDVYVGTLCLPTYLRTVNLIIAIVGYGPPFPRYARDDFVLVVY